MKLPKFGNYPNFEVLKNTTNDRVLLQMGYLLLSPPVTAAE